VTLSAPPGARQPVTLLVRKYCRVGGTLTPVGIDRVQLTLVEG
jgi:hypothetical protein